jgi:hypothetical protein
MRDMTREVVEEARLAAMANPPSRDVEAIQPRLAYAQACMYSLPVPAAVRAHRDQCSLTAVPPPSLQIGLNHFGPSVSRNSSTRPPTSARIALGGAHRPGAVAGVVLCTVRLRQASRRSA